MEYDRYNNLLKIELPRLLDLRSQLLKPGIQTLLAFQKHFYTQSATIFSSATLGALVSEKALRSTDERFEKEIDPVMKEIRTMGMFHGSGLTCKKLKSSLLFFNRLHCIDTSGSPSMSTTSSLGDATTTTNLPNPPEYTSLPPSKTATVVEEKISSARAAPSTPQPNPKSKTSSKRYVKAVYDFASQDSDDLSFKMGDLIEVLDSSDQYGWWVGKDSKGKKGNFPSNYVMEQ